MVVAAHGVYDYMQGALRQATAVSLISHFGNPSVSRTTVLGSGV